MNHSIPDACALAISTPAGLIIQTGDFKVDFTPVDGAGHRPGPVRSSWDSRVFWHCWQTPPMPSAPAPPRANGWWAIAFETLFQKAEDRRIIIATFSSNVHRLQQIVDCCVKHGRKVAVSGRSMVNVVERAARAGIPECPRTALWWIMDVLSRYPDNKLVICHHRQPGGAA